VIDVRREREKRNYCQTLSEDQFQMSIYMYSSARLFQMNDF